MTAAPAGLCLGTFFDDFWDPVFSLLSSGDETPLRRALDGELVDIEGGGARVHRLHHVVPQVLPHLQGNCRTRNVLRKHYNVKVMTIEWRSGLK